MSSKDAWLVPFWHADAVHWENDRGKIFRDYDHLAEILRVDAVVQKIIRTDGDLFSVKVSRLSDRRADATPLGRELIECLRLDIYGLECAYEKHRVSPYFLLLVKNFWNTLLRACDFSPNTVPAFNAVVSAIREEAKSKEFGKLIGNRKRMVRKNTAEVLRYVQGLHAKYSKLLAVRLDLGFKADFRNSRAGDDLDPKHVKRALATLLRHVKQRYPTTVGYVWRLEYGITKGYHFHLLLLFNGQESREDITFGRLIGDHWANVITGGSGTHYCSNRRKDFFKANGTLGIGLVRHDDVQMRANFEKAVTYLAKLDRYIGLDGKAVGRTLGKGVLSRKPAKPRGRPRKHVPLIEVRGRHSSIPAVTRRHVIRRVPQAS